MRQASVHAFPLEVFGSSDEVGEGSGFVGVLCGPVPALYFFLF
jgi:hypothetical protein